MGVRVMQPRRELKYLVPLEALDDLRSDLLAYVGMLRDHEPLPGQDPVTSRIVHG